MRSRRSAVVRLPLALTLLALPLVISTPVLAAGENSVTDLNVAASLAVLRPDTAVTALRLSVEPLKQEETVAGVTTVTLSSDVLFDFGKATRTAPATASIGRIAQQLRAANGPVTVVGHTDAVGTPPTTSRCRSPGRRRCAARSCRARR